MRREVHEETGLDVHVDRLTSVYPSPSSGRMLVLVVWRRSDVRAFELSSQAKQRGVSRAEAARGPVEALQVRFVVDVQPLAPGRRYFGGERLHEGGADSSSLVVRVDDGVEEERVRAAIPASVDEAHERTVLEGADPGQTVAFETLRP